MENKLDKKSKIVISMCDNEGQLSVPALFSLFMDLASEHGTMIRLGSEDLAEKGLIREEAYARALATERITRQHRPRRRVQQELLQRGVDRDTAEQIVNEIATDDLQEALALLGKKRYTDTDMQKLRQKVCGFLARQGFDYVTVRQAWETWYAARGGSDEFCDGGFGDEL